MFPPVQLPLRRKATALLSNLNLPQFNRSLKKPLKNHCETGQTQESCISKKGMWSQVGPHQQRQRKLKNLTGYLLHNRSY